MFGKWIKTKVYRSSPSRMPWIGLMEGLEKERERIDDTVSNQKKIIIEGPDCSGKTTLKRILEQDRYFLAQDRHPKLSKQIFAIANRLPLYDNACIQDIVNDMIKEYDLIVFLLPDISILDERLHERGDDWNDINSIKNLCMVYETIAAFTAGVDKIKVLREPHKYEQDVFQYFLK